MSAIWGKISLDGKAINDKSEMMKSVYERKCRLDKVMEIKKDDVYMACGLQYITHGSDNEKLPYYDTDNYIYFTADCVLDNREELAEKLGIGFDNLSKMPDGMLMLMAYMKFGMECLHHFKGLFSMAVYDRCRQILYLASDPVASRCLYYYKRDNEVVFSTLLEPIQRLFPDIGYNVDYLKDFATAPGLMPNIISDETPYKDVYKLNPGSWLEISRGGISEHEYFDITSPLPDCKCHSAKEYGRYFRQLYSKCVEKAINTKGDVGISLSSGLDSASVGALAAGLMREQNKTLYSYTYVTYEKDVTDKDKDHVLDEKNDVLKLIEMHSNISPHFLNNKGRNCCEDMEKCVDIMEIPFKAYVNLPNLCEVYENAAGQGCRVVLTGQCGNSTVSHGYIDDVLYDFYKNHKCFHFLSYLNNYSKTVGESRKAALRGCIKYFEYTKKLHAEKTFDYRPNNPFVNERITKNYNMRDRYERGGMTLFENVPDSQEVYRSNLYKKAMFTYLGELDTKMGLKYNILLRDATRDADMLRFCYNLPYRYFAYKGTPRWLIRGNFKDILPDYMINNWMRYGVQNADWYERIKRDKPSVAAMMRSATGSVRLSEYADKEKIQDFLNKFESGMENIDKMEVLYLLYICVLGVYLK